MRHLCTISDNNYLLKGLVMYESLVQNVSNFTLHYLCLDELSYEKLSSLKLDNMVIYNLKDYLETDEDLINAKKELKYDEFCWSMSSFFTRKILKKFNSIIYCDSDLYFYNDIDVIYEELGEKSIGLIRHRHTFYGSRIGDFNVGIIYFKNDSVGNESLNFWWSLSKTKNHEHFSTHGSCGDQKYLELFIPEYHNSICILEEKLGHAAPFNFHLYDYSNFSEINKEILYDNKKQKLVFIHFMQFTPNFETNTYKATKESNNQEFLNIPQIKSLYDEYFNQTIKIKKKYNL